MTGSGTKFTPVEAETGQSTPKLPRPLVTMGLALLPTAVLGNLGGRGPWMGRWRSGDPPSYSKVNGWCEVLAVGWKDRHKAGILSCWSWQGFLRAGLEGGFQTERFAGDPWWGRGPWSWGG